MDCYFVYEHWRLDTNVCFYVGLGEQFTHRTNRGGFKGKYPRAFQKSARNDRWKEIVAISNYEVRIIRSFDNKREGLLLESELIHKYGRIGFEPTGTLVNISTSGLGKHFVEKIAPININKKQLYTMKEYANLKNVNYYTVSKWVKSNQLQTTKLPSGRTRIIE